MKPSLLFISINDGTDTRILKEIKSLDSYFEITFIGIQTPVSTADMLPSTCRKIFIKGLRRSPVTIAKLFFQVAQLCPWCFNSVHVVNENLALILYPLLIFTSHWVLDIFDSLFLKSTSPLINRFRVLTQKIIYGSADVILVTDETRLNLLPLWSRKKAKVLPNYPLHDSAQLITRGFRDGPLTIFFSGSISRDRGIPFLLNLLKADPELHIHAAGWLYDQEAQALMHHPRVKYYGVIHQTAAAQLAQQCDYILCLYKPNILNNIYASPNKIYDGIQAGVPVIINKEILIAEFVHQEKLGYILGSYNPEFVADILTDLKTQRNNYKHLLDFSKKYIWEKIENTLIAAHQK